MRTVKRKHWPVHVDLYARTPVDTDQEKAANPGAPGIDLVSGKSCSASTPERTLDDRDSTTQCIIISTCKWAESC